MDTSGLVVEALVTVSSVTTETSGPSGYGVIGEFLILFIIAVPGILGVGGGVSWWTARRGHLFSTDLSERQQRLFQVSAISFAAGVAVALVTRSGFLLVVFGLGLLGFGTQMVGVVSALRATGGE